MVLYTPRFSVIRSLNDGLWNPMRLCEPKTVRAIIMFSLRLVLRDLLVACARICGVRIRRTSIVKIHVPTAKFRLPGCTQCERNVLAEQAYRIASHATLASEHSHDFVSRALVHFASWAQYTPVFQTNRYTVLVHISQVVVCKFSCRGALHWATRILRRCMIVRGRGGDFRPSLLNAV